MWNKMRKNQQSLKKDDPITYKRARITSFIILPIICVVMLIWAFNDENEPPISEPQVTTAVADVELTTEEAIKRAIDVDDEVTFTERNGYVFIQARAVSANSKLVAKEKLYKTVKAVQNIDGIAGMTINVQGPDGNPLLIKYKISGDKLRTIDFSVSGYDNVLIAADQLSGKFGKLSNEK